MRKRAIKRAKITNRGTQGEKGFILLGKKKEGSQLKKESLEGSVKRQNRSKE